MAARRVAIDWDGLERALTRRSRESEAFLDTRTGDIVWVTRGWSDDHGFSDPELDEGLAAGRLVPVLPVPPETEQGWMSEFAQKLEDGWPRDMLDRFSSFVFFRPLQLSVDSILIFCVVRNDRGT